MKIENNNKQIINSKLDQEIILSYEKLLNSISMTQEELFFEKKFMFSGGKASIADIIAYQIGWGNLLISWYEFGIQNEPFTMPGEGFYKWDYNAIAKHFYQKYSYSSKSQYIKEFSITVRKICDIVEKEYITENLSKIGIFEWCKLQSGKEWPLSKWVQVNTIAPYNRAFLLIKNGP